MKRRRPAGFELKLADAVAEVRADYAAFLRAPRAEEEEDARAFGARHAAAKAALAHLEQLIKLAALCDEAAAERQGGGQEVLRQARGMIAEEEAGDGEGGTS